uniref:Uncharacterized protein n=1 Tax=Rhizophora mucronata TaxID=61149 RepID=A0A2P2PSY6_RHIMU
MTRDELKTAKGRQNETIKQERKKKKVRKSKGKKKSKVCKEKG